MYENTSLLHVKSNASIVLKKVSEISKFNHIHQKSKQLNIIMPNTIAQKSVSFRTYLMPSTQNAIKSSMPAINAKCNSYFILTTTHDINAK